MVLHLKKLESLSSKDACAKIGWNWPCGSGEEDFLISSMYFCYIIIISPWKRAGPFVWTFEQNLNPLHPRMLWAKFGWNWPCRSGEEDFLISSIYFRYFIIISPWKRAGPFNLSILNPLYRRMLCAKFGWNWSSGSGEVEKMKMWWQQRRQWWTTDKFWLEKLTWAFGSGELIKLIKRVKITYREELTLLWFPTFGTCQHLKFLSKEIILLLPSSVCL